MDINTINQKVAEAKTKDSSKEIGFYATPNEWSDFVESVSEKMVEDSSITLSKLVQKSYETSRKKGFWDDYKKIANTLADPERRQIMEDLIVCQKLLLTITEIAEAVESMRKSGEEPKLPADKSWKDMQDDELFTLYFEKYQKNSLGDEMGDVIIRLCDLAGKKNIDLDLCIRLKSRYNSLRAKKHGKTF